jgi:hypothetical protein
MVSISVVDNLASRLLIELHAYFLIQAKAFSDQTKFKGGNILESSLSNLYDFYSYNAAKHVSLCHDSYIKFNVKTSIKVYIVSIYRSKW